ncbi:MAG: amino acid ABC transporter permease [Anaerolineales bacterium]
MTTVTASIARLRGSVGRGFNWQLFLQDNFTGSWYLAVWIVFLTLITASFSVGQYNKLPLTTLITLAAWLLGVLMVVVGELRHRHTAVSRWLKENLLSSVSNALLTLFLALALIAAANGIWRWAVVDANFNPAETAPEFQQVTKGATWGVIWGARKLLLTGLLEPENSWRVWLALIFIGALWAVSYIASRPSLRERMKPVGRATTVLWFLSPVILYMFLAGVPDDPYKLNVVLVGEFLVLGAYALLWWQRVIHFNWLSLAVSAVVWPALYSIWWAIGRSEILPPINVDNWGGLMLTLIIAASVIVLSLPIGMLLALGRRSRVYGIPAWIVWPAAIGAAVWGFTATTPQLLADARNTVEQLFAFWPLLILIAAYFFQHNFRGNVVSGASTTFIELVRSVPLITLLFMGIIMAPFFFETGTDIPKPWPVIVGYTFFSSAYMAEVIRGGLQAIPNGQYEAADALGFNTLQKMRFIILPQALRIVIPAIVGQFIGAFKSSSLVSIVGLFDFLGIQRAILSNNQWLGLRTELYVFMAVVYFFGSLAMSSYSRRLEVRLGVGER